MILYCKNVSSLHNQLFWYGMAMWQHGSKYLQQKIPTLILYRYAEKV